MIERVTSVWRLLAGLLFLLVGAAAITTLTGCESRRPGFFDPACAPASQEGIVSEPTGPKEQS